MSYYYYWFGCCYCWCCIGLDFFCCVRVVLGEGCCCCCCCVVIIGLSTTIGTYVLASLTLIPTMLLLLIGIFCFNNSNLLKYSFLLFSLYSLCILYYSRVNVDDIVFFYLFVYWIFFWIYFKFLSYFDYYLNWIRMIWYVINKVIFFILFVI